MMKTRWLGRLGALMLMPVTAVAGQGMVSLPTNGVFNVCDFGAKGDGKTADSAACQAALEAAGKVGGTVYFPAGTYLVHDLKVPERVALKADPKWLFRDTPAGAVLKLDEPKARCVLDITDAYGVRLSGLFLDGIPATPQPVHGILLDHPKKFASKEDSPVIEDVRVQRFSGDGIRLNRVWCFFIRHSMSAYNRGNGVYLRGWDGFVIDNQFSGNHGHGFVSDAQGSTVMFTANRIEWNRLCGLCVEPEFGNSWNVTGNSFDRNFQSNLALANLQGSTVTGNLFRRAGRQLDAPSPWGAPTAQVRLRNCRGIAVTGNTLEAGQDDDGVGDFSPVAGFVIEKLGWCTIRNNTLFHGYMQEAIVDRGGHEQTVVADNPAKPLPLPTAN